VNSIGILSSACPEFLSKGHPELDSETVPKKRNYNVILNLIQDLLNIGIYEIEPSLREQRSNLLKRNGIPVKSGILSSFEYNMNATPINTLF